ncbi:NTP transferase domain-containing protein [Candidatus Woesearchaeota archaeon]|nr:NTP transferase domain-containing protein [Candidatus Woesearchaeota archaeon]
MKALILAGGFGTRLKDIVKDVPKPMARIAGKPFLEHQILFLKEQNITDIILAVHYMAGTIKSYFGTGHRWGVNLTYSEEDAPLGTAGAIKKAEKYIDDAFLVMNGDSYSKVSLMNFLDFHKSNKSGFSISLTKSKDTLHYGNTIMDGSKIAGFSEKESKEGSESALINSGVYIFEPEIFNLIEPDRNVSLEHEIFPKLAREGRLYGFVYEGYFMDIGRPETYNQFKRDMLENLLLAKESDVREAMQRISKNGINLILVTDSEKKLIGVLNDKIIHIHLLNGGGLGDNVEAAMVKNPTVGRTTDDETKISQLLFSGINHLPILDERGRIADVRFRIEEIKPEIYPVIRGKVPLRISFAGGGTDVSHFFEKYGGVVISSTIDKYCRATIQKRADSKIIISSDMGEEGILDSRKDMDYDGRFDIVKAIAKTMGVDFGFELCLHNDIPPGRGLGSSASFAVLMVKLLSQLQGTNIGEKEIAEIAYNAERKELGIKGGWQDQYAAATGGFNFMEFSADKTIIYPLRLKQEVIDELNSHLLLCYVGKAHSSGELHQSQEESFKKNEDEVALKLNELKKIAVEIKDCLLTGKLQGIGELLHESWINKKSVDKNISNPNVDGLYEAGRQNGAYGGKLLGAGAGGYILFFYSPQKRNQLKKALEQHGGEILDFNFEDRGIKTWTA